MTRLLLVPSLTLALTAVAHAQLFPNGDLEAGDTSGWTITYGDNVGGVPTNWQPAPYQINTPGSPHATAAAVDATEPPESGIGVDIDPYGGDWMLKLNDVDGGNHVTRASIQGTLTPQDMDNGGFLYVDWGAVLVDPGHQESEQPFFSVRVLVDSSVIEDFVTTSTGLADDGWELVADWGTDQAYYRHDTLCIDLTGQPLGATVEVEVLVADCDASGHGAYAFVDNVGTFNPELCAPIVGEIACFAPNAFSPNGDDANDTWGFYGYYVTSYRVRIWSGSGNKILDVQDSFPYGLSGERIDIWDGTWQGSPLPPDVFTLQLDLWNCDTFLSKTGTITLVL